MMNVGGDRMPRASDMEIATLVVRTPDLNAGLEGYPSSITASPDSRFAVVSVEGAGQVAIMPVTTARMRSP